MKKLSLILAVSFALFITACQKRQNCCIVPPPLHSQISAVKNGVKWSAATELLNLTPGVTDTLILLGNVGEEHISFIIKKNSDDYYTLVDAKYFTTVGQDAVVSRYEWDKSADYVFVAASPDSKSLQGSFTLSFKQTYGNTTAPGYPATLDFKSGVYSAALPSK